MYKSYEDMLSQDSNKKELPTGTCFPFSKKTFFTADGKILPCEKISHKYVLGYVTEKEILLDANIIADTCNSYYKIYIFTM